MLKFWIWYSKLIVLINKGLPCGNLETILVWSSDPSEMYASNASDIKWGKGCYESKAIFLQTGW
jgi:hypothetical protein